MGSRVSWWWLRGSYRRRPRAWRGPDAEVRRGWDGRGAGRCGEHPRALGLGLWARVRFTGVRAKVVADRRSSCNVTVAGDGREKASERRGASQHGERERGRGKVNRVVSVRPIGGTRLSGAERRGRARAGVRGRPAMVAGPVWAACASSLACGSERGAGPAVVVRAGCFGGLG